MHLRCTFVATLAGVFLTLAPLSAVPIVGLTADHSLVVFDTSTPGALIGMPVSISGLEGGEFITGIDFRPATGQLYAVGNSNRVYTLNVTTGVATPFPEFTTNLSGSFFGIDFNPVADRLRLVSDTDQNLRLNPDDGTVVIDPDLNPGNPNIVAVGYTNNVRGAASTRLYGINSTTDTLVEITNPNGGALTTIGALGVPVSNVAGLDIEGQSGIAYAVFNLQGNGQSELYTINLATGVATLVGTIGGDIQITDISAVPLLEAPEPATFLLFGLGLVAVGAYRRRVA